jgi:alpha-glucosidase
MSLEQLRGRVDVIGVISAVAAAQIILVSPDKTLELRIAADGTSYSLSRKGEAITAASPLGLEFVDAADLSNLAVVNVRKDNRRREIPLTATKAATARDWYNGKVITFRETSGARRRLSIEARAYDDGVAFRYLMPDGAPVVLKGEKTEFRFAYDPQCEVTEYSNSHEKSFETVRLSALDRKKDYDVPVLCATPSGRTHFAIAQAGIDTYAGARLAPVDGGLAVRVTPLPENPAIAIQSPSGLTSGWRVIMAADRAGDLIPSHLIGNLAVQAKGDFSWVKPGMAAWDWWSGPTAGAKPSMDRFRRFIDFAAASGFEYFLIDAGWALNAGPCCHADEKTDITRVDPAIDMPALVQYAKAKGVDLLLWAHWKHVEPRMDEVLDTYKAWGIKGIKVDFTERDDQKMAAFFVRLADATAKRQLLLDMHGAYTPTGLARTYPNYITQEGVKGLEYDKFSWGWVTAGHNVKLAYTRMLLGPMDYTPGGFRNSTPETYVASEIMPMTRTTRGQALAQYVVFDSPLQMVSDDPDAYADAAGFEFLKQVPTSWDETRFIDGTPQSHVILARRKGETWYVGAMTNEAGRTVDVPLSFLGRGEYQAEIWSDGKTANDVERAVRPVSKRDVLHIHMSAGGGGAVVIRRAGSR